MKKIKTFVFLSILLLIAAGCKQEGVTDPTSQEGNVAVKVTASAGSTGGTILIRKTLGMTGTLSTIDSISVQSAIIVLKDIKFQLAIDTSQVRDSLKVEKEDQEESEEMFHSVRFKGPFIVELFNNKPGQVALDTIAPGTYNGIKFVLHKLSRKDVGRNSALSDSLVGYSVVVKGTVSYSDGQKKSFLFKTDIDEEFKVKGNFIVESGDKNVPYVLNFAMASWFKDTNGRTLDPNSKGDRERIRQMIKRAFKDLSRGGKDKNNDGEPD